MTAEEVLVSKGFILQSQTKANVRLFEPGILVDHLLFISGNAAKEDGILKYTGIVGKDVTMEEAKEAAKLAFVNCLASVKNIIGSLENVEQLVNIKGYVACVPEFTQQPQILDAVSALAREVFGDKGKHSRVALGMTSLPGGTPVEVEITVKVKEEVD